MIVMVFESHMVVACFGLMMFELLGYGRGKDWCYIIAWCFGYGSYGRMMC